VHILLVRKHGVVPPFRLPDKTPGARSEAATGSEPEVGT
jgi:hypothetical protein